VLAPPSCAIQDWPAIVQSALLAHVIGLGTQVPVPLNVKHVSLDEQSVSLVHVMGPQTPGPLPPNMVHEEPEGQSLLVEQTVDEGIPPSAAPVLPHVLVVAQAAAKALLPKVPQHALPPQSDAPVQP
jgi:hypothetical protein